ncbi:MULTISPECIES: hypothetical protein [unclassified Nocardiopsis]|uniref:hypothetical protein n=1 Tax=unclassified Nocardiopsis TaxID=2649073 RepID=UPI00135C0907|nr:MULTISPECIES: hypothetical protein [unclassified Nocardiopsis]
MNEFVNGGGAAAELLTEEDRTLLVLLAECANDEQVARRALMSVRTVRRRVARLMELLSVNNRYALGVAACGLGLVARRSGTGRTLVGAAR